MSLVDLDKVEHAIPGGFERKGRERKPDTFVWSGTDKPFAIKIMFVSIRMIRGRKGTCRTSQ